MSKEFNNAALKEGLAQVLISIEAEKALHPTVESDASDGEEPAAAAAAADAAVDLDAEFASFLSEVCV